MEENTKSTNIGVEEDEEGIDLIVLVKGLWLGRKTVIIWTCVFMVIGLLMALLMPRKRCP